MDLKGSRLRGHDESCPDNHAATIRTSFLLETAEGLRRVSVVMGAEPGEHGFEALKIFFTYGEETKAQSPPALYVANDGVGLDASFLNEEVQLSRHALFDLEVRSLDEKAVNADVEDAGNVVAAIAAPADPNVFRSGKANKSTAGIRRFLLQDGPPRADASAWW